MSGRFVDVVANVIVTVEVEDVGDEIEGVLVVLNFGVQASEVEPVIEIVFVDFTEILVAAGGDELDRREQLVRGSSGQRKGRTRTRGQNVLSTQGKVV